jgi:hypothetical protein
MVNYWAIYSNRRSKARGIGESIRPRTLKGPLARRNPVLEPVWNHAHLSYVKGIDGPSTVTIVALRLIGSRRPKWKESRPAQFRIHHLFMESKGLPEVLVRSLGAGVAARYGAAPPACFMDRRMRNRMSGGVGGRGPQGPLLPDNGKVFGVAELHAVSVCLRRAHCRQ